MADAEGVVFAFGARRERREAAALLDGVEPVAPAGQHLVRIGLVADVPHQAVVRRVEDVVQRDGELDRAEARGEMSAARGDAADQVFAQLGADFAEPVFGLARRSAGEIQRAQQREGFRGQWTLRAKFTRRAGRRQTQSAQLARATRKLREFAQVREARAPGRERRNGAIAARERLRARLFQAEHRRICRLDAVGVRAGALAERVGSAFDVEDVVLDLEGQADLGAELGERRALRQRLDSPAEIAPSSTLAWISAPVFWRCMRSSAASSSACLTASRSMAWPPAMPRVPMASARTRSISRRAAGGDRRRRVRQHFEGARLQRVAGEDRGGFVEGAMAGGPAAAQVVVVHGGQVVVHQAVDVDELDRGGRGIEQFERRAERFAGGVHQHRPHAFAARERAVAHGFEQARGRAAVDFERAREHAFDALLVERNAVGQETRRRRRARASALVGVIVVVVIVVGETARSFPRRCAPAALPLSAARCAARSGTGA